MNPPVAFPYSRVFFALLLIATFVSALWKYYKYRRRQYYVRKRADVSTSASHFDRLPYELVEEIMSYLDLPSLLAAAQVNPQWNNYPCIHSLTSAICNKEFAAKNFLTKDKDIRCPQETSFNVYPSTYKPQWHVEDRYLANRLNKKVLDVTVDTALMIRFQMPNRPLKVLNYVVKTSLKWKREYEKYVVFNNASVGTKRKLKIPKRLIKMKNIAEEYDVIADLNEFQFQGITLNKIYRFRAKKLLDWRLGVLLMLALIYGPILVMDIRALLQCYPNSAPYLVHILGVLTSYILVAVFCWFFVKVIRDKPILLKVASTTLVGSLLSVYIWLAGRYPNYWRNNGLCWIIGGCIEGYEWLFKAFWFRRHQFGLKIATAMTTAITILFVYAIDWSLAIEYIVTNRIWMTMFVNLIQIWTVWIQYSAAQFIIETIIHNLKPYWNYFDTLNRKMLQRAIPAQILIAILCSFYAPAGFDFPQ